MIRGKNALESSLAGNNEKKKKLRNTVLHLYTSTAFMDISTRMSLKNFELRLFRTEMIIFTARPTQVCSLSVPHPFCPVSVSGITKVSVPPLSRRLHSRSISSAQAVTFPCLDHCCSFLNYPSCFCYPQLFFYPHRPTGHFLKRMPARLSSV